MIVGVESELMKVFGFWAAIVGFKLVAMVPLTARQRFSKMIFMNPEDAIIKGSKVMYNDPDVERVRRAHLNDLENILPWFFVTYIWLTTGPSLWLASLLIKAFVIARIVHTIVYIIIPQQPMRAISFFVGFFITIYQLLSTLVYYM